MHGTRNERYHLISEVVIDPNHFFFNTNLCCPIAGPTIKYIFLNVYQLFIKIMQTDYKQVITIIKRVFLFKMFYVHGSVPVGLRSQKQGMASPIKAITRRIQQIHRGDTSRGNRLKLTCFQLGVWKEREYRVNFNCDRQKFKSKLETGSNENETSL